ncbi:MAG: hypothetical protein Q8Q48_03475 [Candidatus Staskawiczbacteria bacterium]|nr:hypothetical protein [Candidatus Staskawiczbacteria bacterium]
MNEITNRDNEPEQELPSIQETLEQKTEREQGVEHKLSPEVLEKILTKIEDIGTDGIAYANVGRIGSIDLVTRNDLEEAGVMKLQLQDDVEKLRENIANSRILKELEELHSIFEKGLIGVNQYKDEAADFKKFGGKEYREYLRTTNKSQVHFNIIGRNSLSKNIVGIRQKSPELNNVLDIGFSRYMTCSGSVGIIFDISDLREVLPKGKNFTLGSGKKTERIFSAADIRDVIHWHKEDQNGDWRQLHEYAGRDIHEHPEKYLRLPDDPPTPIEDPYKQYVNKFVVTPSDEYGFITSPRIKPKKFKGVVISIVKKSPGREGGWATDKYDVYSEKELQERAEIIASEMQQADKDKPELLLPIYDTAGRLLWPEQMSYEEVKKFVAERDAEKEK